MHFRISLTHGAPRALGRGAARFMTTRKKQIFLRAVGILKEINREPRIIGD